jgi:ubiquinone/menaquinone biosynthesis C-methylase UbiE
MDQVNENKDHYIWGQIRDPAHLAEVRMGAMTRFLADYELGIQQGRYVNASLPDLPFSNNSFDLALCSHFLFLYSEQVDVEQHLNGLQALCRVAKEVRVYPILGLDNQLSPHLQPVSDSLTAQEFIVSRHRVDYQFQKGAVDMLVVKQRN